MRQVIAIDLATPRLEAARRAGAMVVDGTTDDLIESVKAVTGPGAYRAPAACDAVIDCAGSPALLTTAITALRPGGTLVLAALYDEPLALDATSVVEHGVRIVGTFGYDDDFGRAVALVADGRVTVEGVVTHRFGLEEIGEAFATQGDAARSVKVLVEPGLDP